VSSSPDPITVAAVAALGAVVAAQVAGMVALWAQQHKLRGKYDRLWLYTRQLVDDIYRGVGPPPRQPPDDLFE
jgi:hypothetical protein